MTALISLLIASIAVFAAGTYGYLTGQNTTSARDPKVIFQEKGTGARYVYMENDTKLHPVLNYASGVLLSTGETPSLKSIAAKKLSSVTLGAPLGIPGAPDSVPGNKDLITDRWSVCTDQEGQAGGVRSTLLVGDRITTGTVAEPDRGPAQALLVSDPESNKYLVYGNRKFLFPPELASRTQHALGWGVQPGWSVSAAWINAVPSGPDLRAPKIPPSTGSASADGYRVGQLVKNGPSYGVIMEDGGMADVTPMQGALIQASGKDPIEIGSDFSKLKPSKQRLSDVGTANPLPQLVPDLISSTPKTACVTLPVDRAHGFGVRIDPTIPPGGLTVTGLGAAPGTNQADVVHVVRGKGAIVEGVASAGAPAGSGTYGVVTDTGRLYTLANRGLLTKFGYDEKKLQRVPSTLLSLLPRGPSLDPALARQTDPQG